jgi:hypothetical protein
LRKVCIFVYLPSGKQEAILSSELSLEQPKMYEQKNFYVSKMECCFESVRLIMLSESAHSKADLYQRLNSVGRAVKEVERINYVKHTGATSYTNFLTVVKTIEK